MRDRLHSLLPSVLALSFVMLLAIPAATSAQSGLPATVSMYPPAAGPGETVEVTGLDFPRDTTVVLELSTSAGSHTLATVATAGDGSFQDLVTLPADAPDGAWSLLARSADGVTTSRYAFEAGEPVEVVPVVDPVAAAAAASSGPLSDKLFLVVIAVVLGILATAALYAWQLVQDEGPQPGMGSGDDLIWSGSRAEEAPELTATSEPYWKDAGGEAEAEPAPGAMPEAATTA